MKFTLKLHSTLKLHVEWRENWSIIKSNFLKQSILSFKKGFYAISADEEMNNCVSIVTMTNLTLKIEYKLDEGKRVIKCQSSMISDIQNILKRSICACERFISKKNIFFHVHQLIQMSCWFASQYEAKQNIITDCVIVITTHVPVCFIFT